MNTFQKIAVFITDEAIAEKIIFGHEYITEERDTHQNIAINVINDLQ